MYRPRIIPVLLLKGNILVKSEQFKKHNYIGDPINAVRIYNDLKADEIVFLDIEASAKNKLISLDFVKDVGEEANMPFGVGGGIKTLEDIEKIIQAGAERVIINSASINFDFIKKACNHFGSSTIAVCIDVRKKRFSGVKTFIKNGTKSTKLSPVEMAKKMESLGVGEIILQSIDRDGTMKGYDISLIKEVAQNVSIPVVALGGASTDNDLIEAYDKGYANGLAAGSKFVYQGENKGVLINYVNKNEIIFNRKV